MEYNEAFRDRFWSKVDASGVCWEWTASTKGNGYGQVKHKDRKSPLFAHRASYEMLVGAIPDGLTLDHLCKNTLCVNPDHLEVVEMRVNVLRSTAPTAINARKTHCPQGHEYTPDNLVKDRGRRCKVCHREKVRRQREARI
jgi:hypothetical protein